MPVVPSAGRVRDDFLSLDEQDRLQLLLEFSQELPELPERYADHPDLFERVVECQAPVYIFVEVLSGKVYVYATAPREAPTTRGFASILIEVLNGLPAQEALALEEDFAQTLGLTRIVSLLRLQGMTGMIVRIKRQIRSKIEGDFFS